MNKNSQVQLLRNLSYSQLKRSSHRPHNHLRRDDIKHNKTEVDHCKLLKFWPIPP